MTANSTGSGVDGLVHATFFTAGLDALGIPFVVFEPERIGRGQVVIQFDKATVVYEQADVLFMSDEKVVVAFGADPVIALQSVLVDGVAALFTLGPDTFRNLALDPGFESGFHSFEPVHKGCFRLNEATSPQADEGQAGCKRYADRSQEGRF